MLGLFSRRLMPAILGVATALLLGACGGGGGDGADGAPGGGGTTPPPGATTVTVSGTASLGSQPIAGAKVALAAADGAVLGETTAGDDGRFSFEAAREAVAGGVALTVTEGRFLGEPFDGTLRAVHTAERLDAANATALSSLLIEWAARRGEAGAAERRAAALAELVRLGLADAAGWHLPAPASVDADALLDRVLRQGFAAWLESTTAALQSGGELPAGVVAVFPSAQGGLIGLRFESDGPLRALRGFAAAERLVLDSREPTEAYRFAIVSGPAGVTVDDRGVLSYTPAATGPASTEPVTVSVTHRSSGLGRIVGITAEALAVDVVTSGIVGTAGGQLMNDWQDVVLTVPPGAVDADTTLELVRARTPEGTAIYRLRASAPMRAPARLAAPREAAVAAPVAGPLRRLAPGRSSALAADPEGWVVRRAWHADFLEIQRLGLNYKNRLRTGHDCQVLEATLEEGYLFSRLVCELGAVSAQLESSCRGDGDCAGKTPVLLIHGYDPMGGLGGAETWGSLKEHLANLDERRYAVYAFRWQTNANFRDVAAELEQAIKVARADTGQRVHLVAHSFGGLLARAYLQDQAAYGLLRYDAQDVRTLVTLGTPHSGIAPTTLTRDGITLPDGVDYGLLRCGQVSCFMAGHDDRAPISFVDADGHPVSLAVAFGVSESPGELPVSLAASAADFPVDLLVLMGLQTRRPASPGLSFWTVADGDNLISFEGQRFMPDWLRARPGTQPFTSSRGIHFEERVLGDVSNAVPGQAVPRGTIGYSHTRFVEPTGSHFEARIDSDTHHTWIALRDWLAAERYAPEPPAFPERFSFTLTLKDPTNGLPIEGARAEAVYAGVRHGEATSAADGSAALEVGFHPRRRLDLTITAPGYRSARLTNALRMEATAAATPGFLGTVFLTPEMLVDSAVSGRVVHALTGRALPGVSVSLRTGSRELGVVTDAGGAYSFGALVPGTYELVFRLDGFAEQSRMAVVTGGVVAMPDSSMTPRLAAGQTRIRLSWGANPRDLDSHLRRYTGGVQDYFVYYLRRRSVDAVLDLDDTNGFGPETITIDPTSGGSTYRYVVHRYAGSGSIATSDAVVAVNTADGEVEFRPPAEAGDYWHVFDIVGGEVVPCRSACMSRSWPTGLGLPDAGAHRLEVGTGSAKPRADGG